MLDTNLISDSGEKKNIGVLIADNDKGTRAFLNTALNKKGGFSIWTAATAKESLEILGTIPVDNLSVVMFDLTQKGMNGTVLLQKIRTEINYISVGILICSDALSSEDLFLLKEMNVDHFLARSSGTTEFIDKIIEVDKEVKEKTTINSNIRKLESALRSNDLNACNTLLSNEEFSKNLEIMPELIPYKAEILIAEQEIEKAIDLLKGFLQIEAKAGRSETLHALSTLGRALCAAKKYDEALGIFQRLTEKSPHNLGHKINLGDSLLGNGDIEGAEKQFQEVLSQDPDNTKAMVGIGSVRLASGDTEGAVSLFSRIKGPIESYSLASYFNNAAVALIHKGKIEDSVELYLNALQFFDKYKGLIYFNLGMAQLRIGKTIAACESFDFVLRLASSEFIEKKAILREYRDLGADHMITKYKNNENQ